MANIGLERDSPPLAPARLQKLSDLAVNFDLHDAILVKYSSNCKQHFTRVFLHPQAMAKKELPINEVVAENLAYWMEQAGLKQSALAVLAGVSQKTISNYLNPKQRNEGASGKPPVTTHTPQLNRPRGGFLLP